jgi:hypothetical protein
VLDRCEYAYGDLLAQPSSFIGRKGKEQGRSCCQPSRTTEQQVSVHKQSSRQIMLLTNVFAAPSSCLSHLSSSVLGWRTDTSIRLSSHAQVQHISQSDGVAGLKGLCSRCMGERTWTWASCCACICRSRLIVLESKYTFHIVQTREEQPSATVVGVRKQVDEEEEEKK